MASATNPESGAVSYGYDSNSNLTSRKDARNITSTYSYDKLNRLTGVSYSDGVTPNVTYAYDTATNGKGLLASVTSSAATDTVASYDVRGNVTGSSQTIGGHAYNFSYAYNLADAPTSTTYPSGRVVANTYDGANRVATVASGSTTYLSGVSYAAFGGFAGHTYGNGIARAYSYNSLLQPSEMKDTGGGYTLLDNVLNWTGGSNNGNLPSQTVKQNGPNFSGGQIQFSPSYGYDTLNRLTSAGETGNWSQSFGYDQYGNMWLSGNSGTLPTQVLMPNSQSSYNAANNRLTTPAYDAAGNQETYSTYTLTYDAENRQTKASDSSSGETYTYSYDGLGERTSKTAQGVTTSYVHDAFGNLAAEYTSNTPVDQPCTTCYLSWDHLGSTRLVTDSGGIVVARHDFLPFGQELSGGFGGRDDFWGQTDQVTAKFTSQERDVEAALDFFQSRYHANQQGRFLSVDPGQAGADPGNPQSWNGYGYVLGSPMVKTDPDGTDTFDPDPIGDPCDGDPTCGWGGGFPPIWPGGNPQPPPPPPPPAVSTGGLNVPNSGVYGSSFVGQYPCLDVAQLNQLEAILLNIGSSVFGAKLSQRAGRVVIGGADNIYIQDGPSGDGIPVDPNVLTQATAPSPIFEPGFKKQIIVPAPSNLPGPGKVVHILFNPSANGQGVQNVKIHADIANPQDVVGIIAHTWSDILAARRSSSAGNNCAVKFN